MKRTEFIQKTEQQLRARRDALRRTLAGDVSSLRSQHDAGVGDEIDDAIAGEQAELRSQMASYESRELAQIEHALDKIRKDRYGRCEICGKAIAPMRLKALPYATECIVCARQEERRPAYGSGATPVNRIAVFSEEENESALDQAYEEIG